MHVRSSGPESIDRGFLSPGIESREVETSPIGKGSARLTADAFPAGPTLTRIAKIRKPALQRAELLTL